ncbi:MBL fold metallo-hydrolase [Methylobacterium sp. Leaf89]|nr:MBL fold metallo-hydrolase [Methylobacterium sp. Leaf89]
MMEETPMQAGLGSTIAMPLTGLAGPGLAWTHFPAGPKGFFRAPVLIEGPTEAILIDGGFTVSDGRAIAAAIAATGKRLATIYVSQSDPDYYFGLKPLCEAFPEARVLAASATVSAIARTVDAKIAAWGPQLGAEGPGTRADVVMPTPFDGAALSVDGETVEIVPAMGLPNRRTLFVPALNAVFGGVLIFSGVHVWTADTPSPEARAAWIAELDRIAARAPSVVVPGHLAVEAATDGSALAFTRSYLLAFEEALAAGGDAAALKAAMLARFPGLGMDIALDIGAKVATGEMVWG